MIELTAVTTDRIILQGPVNQPLLDRLVIRTRPSPIRPLLPSSPLIGNYFALTPTHQVVWWIVEADVDVLEGRFYAASS